MIIWINDHKVEVFSGARVGDVLRLYRLNNTDIPEGLDEIKIIDKWGNYISLDGELADGDRLFVKQKEEDDKK